MRKVLRMIGISIGLVVGILLVSGILFLNLSPQFGRTPSKEQRKAYSTYDNYEDGKFVNATESPMDIKMATMLEFFKTDPARNPSKEIKPDKVDSSDIATYADTLTRLTWFGHSAFLLEIDGKKILLDPMFGPTPAPIKWFGTKRYFKDLPIDISKLPPIDAVIISHDHYDHLDYGSIKELKKKVGHFYMPIGVGNHLRRWGVAEEKIHELNWWETAELNGLELVSCPSRHFSGRGLFDRAKTLWCSWVIKGRSKNVYFSGDSGYDRHFSEIGEKYGPFDIALLECGQYNEEWKYIHMMPEETVRAAIDVKADLAMPIHWGAFTLALHSWTDPVKRFTAKASELNIKAAIPRIGQPILLESPSAPVISWWEEYN